MIAALILCVLVGVLVGLAVAAWHRPQPTKPQATVTSHAIGVDLSGRGGVSLEVHHARMLRQVFENIAKGSA
jgi:hypothetical protein